MKYALTNCHIIDGTIDMKVQDGLTILIDEDKIVDIIDKNTNYSGYKVIDLKGQYILPGLINLHVHLPSSGKPRKKSSDPRKLVKFLTRNRLLRRLVLMVCESNAKKQLLSGTTTIRTVGGVVNTDSRIRDRINSGKVMGPRMLVSNVAITVKGGHMEGSVAIAIKTEEEGRAMVREVSKDKPDLIKLMITGGVLDAKVKGEPGELKMSPEIVRACCDEAHKLGFVVAAHVQSPEGVKVALENGVDTIEHGAKPDKEMIELFKKRNACHVATISPALPFVFIDKPIIEVNDIQKYNGNVVFEGGIECAKECLDNGVAVGLGTDTGCPYITQYDMWREVNYYHKFCGVSKQFALYTATLGNAKIIHLDNIIGSIEKGKIADLIVCKDNPLEDLTVLRKLSYVIARGKIIKNPKVKKFKNVEKTLDEFI